MVTFFLFDFSSVRFLVKGNTNSTIEQQNCKDYEKYDQLMEPHKVLSVISSDVDVLAVHGDERSHKEISKGISTVPGRDRTGSLQETSAGPSK